jgi:hypothetical protein
MEQTAPHDAKIIAKAMIAQPSGPQPPTEQTNKSNSK